MKLLTHTLTIVAITALAALGSGGARPALAGDIPFETIDKSSGGFERYCDFYFSCKSAILITDRIEWVRFWIEHSSDYEIPEVNFGREMVVAVSLGTQSTSAGPSIEITRIEDVNGETRIHVLADTRQGPALALSNPTHVVKFPRVKGPIAIVHMDVPPWFCATDLPCPPGGVCDLPNFCDAGDLPGRCVARQTCAPVYEPVCGCDGVTYDNDCERLNAGAILAHTGACP